METVLRWAYSSAIHSFTVNRTLQCCVYSIGEPSITNYKPESISLPALGSIKMAALSTDGAFVAFIITQKPGGTEMDCLKYLCTTEDLIRTAADG